MNTNFFAALLRCNDCTHAVELHGPAGCDQRDCACRHTREGVIDNSIGDAKAEATAQLEAMRVMYPRRQ